MKRLLLASVVVCLSGCTTSEHLDAYRANSHLIDATAVDTFATNQETIFTRFTALAGGEAALPKLSDGRTNLRPVVNAGIHYVDVRCTGYLQAVFWFNRAKNASTEQTQLLGSASAAALEVLEASRQLVALTPLGFTLLNDSIENLGSSLLFSLPPEAVGQLVEERQRAYRSGLSETYTNRASALAAIQGYVDLCLANNIEGAAIDAIASRQFEPDDSEPPAPAPAPTATPTPTPTPTPAPAPAVDEIPSIRPLN